MDFQAAGDAVQCFFRELNIAFLARLHEFVGLGYRLVLLAAYIHDHLLSNGPDSAFRALQKFQWTRLQHMPSTPG